MREGEGPNFPWKYLPSGRLHPLELDMRISGMRNMHWEEVVSSFMSRNDRRYWHETNNEVGLGAMILYPNDGQGGIDNPISTIHIQGIKTFCKDMKQFSSDMH